MRVPLARPLSLASPTRRLKRKRQQRSRLLILCLRCASLRQRETAGGPGLTCTARTFFDKVRLHEENHDVLRMATDRSALLCAVRKRRTTCAARGDDFPKCPC